MRNQLQTFFLEPDENNLSSALQEDNPNIFFIDRDKSTDNTSQLKKELRECSSRVVMIWSASSDELGQATEEYTKQVSEKKVTASCQLIRSRIVSDCLVNGSTPDVLISGRVAACYRGQPTETQAALKKAVYTAVNAISSRQVYHVNPVTRTPLKSKSVGLRVGSSAIQWCKNPNHLLRDASVKTVYYLPAATD